MRLPAVVGAALASTATSAPETSTVSFMLRGACKSSAGEPADGTLCGRKESFLVPTILLSASTIPDADCTGAVANCSAFAFLDKDDWAVAFAESVDVDARVATWSTGGCAFCPATVGAEATAAGSDESTTTTACLLECNKSKEPETITPAASAAQRRLGHAKALSHRLSGLGRGVRAVSVSAASGMTGVTSAGSAKTTISRQSAHVARCSRTPWRSSGERVCSAKAVSKSASGCEVPDATRASSAARSRSYTILVTSVIRGSVAPSFSGIRGRDFASRERFWPGILRQPGA